MYFESTSDKLMKDMTARFSVQTQEFSGWCGSKQDNSEATKLFPHLILRPERGPDAADCPTNGTAH